MRLNIPTPVVLVLGLVGGVLQYLNQATFGFAPPWHEVITYGLFALAIFGVSPLVGGNFRNALHLTVSEATAVTTVATLIAAAITTFALSNEVRGVLEGAVSFLAFVGFGPAAIAALRSAPPARP